MTDFIPLAVPSFGGNEKQYVNECLDSTWISSIGEFICRFESRFAEYCQVKHAIACSNGTVALHLALLGAGVGPGDEVIVPSLTYVASANAVRYCGAEPVFVDSDLETWNLDPRDLTAKISKRTKAIMAVHLYGRPSPMFEIKKIAAEHELKVVEDAAEAIGAMYDEKPVGSLGDIAAFSFFGNKIITCGEGGMVLTDDDEVAERVRQLKGQGQDSHRRYWFPVIGYNYRMTNIQAALGLAQLEHVEEFLAARDEIDRWYRTELVGVPGISIPVSNKRERNVCWLFSVVLPNHDELARDKVISMLQEQGIDSRPFFYPCHTLPPYVARTGSNPCVNATWLGARGLSLPTWVGISREQVRRVSETLVRVTEATRQQTEADLLSL